MTSSIAGPGRYGAYTGRTTAWAVVAATVVASMGLIVMAASSGGPRSGLVLPLLLAMGGVALEVVTASSVRATAGPNGFTIHWGVVGWPRCTYPIDRIERAEVIDLPWWRVSFGFWWTPRRTSCTLRSGPTVRLRLTNGRIVTVTVPQPEVAVAALDEAMRARRRA